MMIKGGTDIKSASLLYFYNSLPETVCYIC